MIGALILVLAAVSLGLSLWTRRRDMPLCWEFAPVEPVDPGGAPLFETVLDHAADAGQAHSPSILVTETGFSVLWFEGSAEAQADVDLFAADIAPGPDGWQASAPGRRVTRADLGRAMEPRQMVITLGNTIEDESRTGGLLATVVSVGGWAMASVARVAMGPDGPVRARKLNLSPMLNRSVLVKSPMVAYADASHGLPAYFEMGRMHGLWVRCDAAGRVRHTVRMDGPGLKPIQPMVVPLGPRVAVALLRDFDVNRGRLLVSRTTDGGQSWSAVTQTTLYNPSSPVAALALDERRILMAANDDEGAAQDLRLLLSDDGGNSWRAIHRLSGGQGALRYPMLRRLGGGKIALCYSHSTKGGVRAHVMNRAWIEAQDT